jgi:ketosteroid isomerase-like protein
LAQVIAQAAGVGVAMHGHKNMRGYWNELHETWAGLRMDPLEAFDLGEGRFVVDLRMWGKGQRSGVEVDQRLAMLYTFRLTDGKIIHAQLFADVAGAISAGESLATETAA